MENSAKIERAGRVVAAHGRRVVVEDDSGGRRSCRMYGRRLRAVCGDRVRWVAEDAEGAEGLVTAVEPRRSELARISANGDSEVIVANLDQLVAVLAPVPTPDFDMCDRYLAAAEWSGLEAAIVLNKSDLPAAEASGIAAELATYGSLGYTVARTSKRVDDGARPLAAILADRTSVLVGQSGVGKSSLLNMLIPGVEATVQEISRATEEGRHTTTASSLYALPEGGSLIDSPGVRDFAPPLPSPRDVATGFREIVAESAGCRFPDCRHTGEPGCQVTVAAKAGRISARRLSSYRQVLKLAGVMEDKLRSTGRLRGARTPPVRK